MAAKKKPQLPSAGDAFAFPIGDGRYSACRVLLDINSKQSKRMGVNSILIAGSAWIGAKVPKPNVAALRTILRLNHHAWKNVANTVWVDEEPPADLIPIGVIEPTAADKRIRCHTFGGWQAITFQPLLQWRWDHEREAMLAEDEAEARAAMQQDKTARQARQDYLDKLTLKDLRRHVFFRRWKTFPSARYIKASRMIMAGAVAALLMLGRGASKKARLAVLQACIESFNESDAESHWIETTAREDICEEFEAIVHACGLGEHKDLADEWRDW